MIAVLKAHALLQRDGSRYAYHLTPKASKLPYSSSSSTNGSADHSPTAAFTIAPTPITSRTANSKPPTIAPTKPFNRSSISSPLNLRAATVELFLSTMLRARI
jgi:hypothetical protein